MQLRYHSMTSKDDDDDDDGFSGPGRWELLSYCSMVIFN